MQNKFQVFQYIIDLLGSVIKRVPLSFLKQKIKKDEPQVTKFSYGKGFELPDRKTQMKDGKNASKPDSHVEGAPLQMAEYPK